MNNLLLILAILTTPVFANGTGVAPAVVVPNVSGLVVNNQVTTNASTVGSGSSTSKAITVSTISAAKAPVLSIEASTVGHAENVATGNGTGTAATNSQIGGTASKDFGIGKGIVGVNVTETANAGTNQVADIASAGRATVDAKVVNGVLTETKTAISQTVGAGNVVGSANAGAAFSNTANPVLPNLGLPSLPNCTLPTY
jgi:hypothetical protein